MKVGIIGCAGHYRFAVESADRFHTCAIQAVADPGDSTDTSALRALAQERGIPFYEDWRRMLDAEDLDLIVVDSRFDRHAELSIACLERGLHVCSEKPLATTLEDLERLRAAWQASGKALGGMFNLRGAPWFLAVRKAIEDGEIGEVRMIHGQKSYKFGTRPDFYRSREEFGGLIPWVAIHALDWVLALGGRCHSVTAHHSTRGNHGYGPLEMSAAILMKLDNEVLATVTADFFRPVGAARHDDDRVRVTGTKGMLEAVDGRVWLENDAPRRELPLPEAADCFGDFLRAIRAGEDPVWAERALEATRVSLLARISADTSRAQGETDLPISDR